MRYIVFIASILACCLPAMAQRDNAPLLRGRVLSTVGSDTAAVVGAHVQIAGSASGAATDTAGRFTLRSDRPLPVTLIVSHVGTIADTLLLSSAQAGDILLSTPRALAAMDVTGERKDIALAPIDAKTDIITQAELKKAPCCELSGCFGTTAAVETAVTDIITDTRELRMLGLAGVYTQVLLDNTPSMFLGINHSIGLSLVPGPIIGNIGVSKGANSVLQGAESVSGQVNVLLKNGTTEDPLFVNAFATSNLEKQLNLQNGLTLGETWSTFNAFHMTQPANAMDGNGDGFLDHPRITRYSLHSSWKHIDDEELMAQLTGRYTDENRIGGQRHFDPDRHSGDTAAYGQTQRNRRLELYGKLQSQVGEDLILYAHAAGSLHTARSWYGTTRYTADQTGLYGDAYAALTVADEHVLRFGASVRSLLIDETVDLGLNPHAKTYGGSVRNEQIVPGVFTEASLIFIDDILTATAGLRADMLPDAGAIVTPRVFLRWNPTLGTTIRASAGSGYRSPLLLSENVALLASSRNLLLPQGAADPERAVNAGLNVVQLYDFSFLKGSIAADFYHTVFTRQWIADYDADAGAVLFRHALGNAASSVASVEVVGELPAGFTAKASWVYKEVYENTPSGRRHLPFVERHRLLFGTGYNSPGGSWSLHATAEWFGTQRLPVMDGYPAELRLPATSDPYTLVNAQVTKRFGMLEVYGGVDNALDFRQPHPIINAAHPFDAFFEPTFAWGPVKGREFFLGLRFRLAAGTEE